jgi:hypothetical protein
VLLNAIAEEELKIDGSEGGNSKAPSQACTETMRANAVPKT